ncbi:MAG: S-adenosylmethionine:tRNA ribosyltransferase-isomerase, partial [Limnobacter sp.]
LDDRRFTAMIRASKSPKPGSDIVLAGIATARVLSKHDMMYELELLESSLSLPELLEKHGALPLPPYIEHSANAQDDERYQT